MKTGIVFFIFIATGFTSWSQTDSVSNSFLNTYKQTNPTLHYTYDEAKQIHNYSDNWDFDLDGKMDQLFFIGTGGAHVYYYLRIILSSDGLIRNYPFLSVDFPFLSTSHALTENSTFSVFDYTNDSKKNIFIHIDEATRQAHSKQLVKAGINSEVVRIFFLDGQMVINNYY